MISQENLVDNEVVQISSRDRMTCAMISDTVIIQCILVFVGALSILTCAWTPDVSTLDYDKLARIMYLFDFEACAYKLAVAKGPPEIKFSNDTKGLNIYPIPWKKTITTVTTRLSAKTRLYMYMSLTVHTIWLLLAILHRVIANNSTDPRTIKFVLAIFFYYCVFMILFDVSMSLVYISHIKQSLTKGMVLRYSGWSSTLKLKSYDDFAGWLPIVASICWIRGVIILLMNIYCCRSLNLIRKQITRQEIKKKYENERYTVIPEPNEIVLKSSALIYRAGVNSPNRY